VLTWDRPHYRRFCTHGAPLRSPIGTACAARRLYPYLAVGTCLNPDRSPTSMRSLLAGRIVTLY